jgi:AcrR family transcriptional regulator
MVSTRVERVKQGSRRRRDQEKQELRQAILNAAGELILELGYEGFSLRRVAERIGYSATTIYLYFDNKDALVAAVVDEGFRRFMRALEAVETSGPLERLADLGRAYVRFALANRVYYQLMFMQRADLLRYGRHHDRYAPGESTDDSFGVLLRAVQAAIDAGALRPGDARAYSFVLWSVVHGVASLVISRAAELDEATTAAATELALGMAVRGLARP